MIEVSSEQSRNQFIRIQSVAAAAVAALVCCYSAVVAAAVCHRVPDGQICCGFVESDLSVFFIQTQFIF